MVLKTWTSTDLLCLPCCATLVCSKVGIWVSDDLLNYKLPKFWMICWTTNFLSFAISSHELGVLLAKQDSGPVLYIHMCSQWFCVWSQLYTVLAALTCTACFVVIFPGPSVAKRQAHVPCPVGWLPTCPVLNTVWNCGIKLVPCQVWSIDVLFFFQKPDRHLSCWQKFLGSRIHTIKRCPFCSIDPVRARHVHAI